MNKNVARNFDDYLKRFPVPVQRLLRELRAAIRKAAPQAAEKISYGMPAFILQGRRVYFAGYAKHIGFYPGSSAIAECKKEIAAYKHAKGSVQFPIAGPLPLALVTRMVKIGMQQNLPKGKKAGKAGRRSK